MKIFKSSENLPPFSSSSVAIGKFDGVHLGHQLLLERTRELAFRDQLRSVVVTFNVHPLSVLAPQKAPQAIIPFEKRCELIAEAGIDALYVIEFDQAYAHITAEKFVEDVLVKTLQAKHVLVGENFHFGHQAVGNTQLLKTLGTTLGFETHVQPLLIDETGEPISSRRVRQAFMEGDMETAENLLGYKIA